MYHLSENSLLERIAGVSLVDIIKYLVIRKVNLIGLEIWCIKLRLRYQLVSNIGHKTVQ